MKVLVDPRRRGFEFEAFIGSLFRSAHFEVIQNPSVGGSRQVDLLAKMGGQIYLVEAKWWKRKPGPAEVQGLEDRLRRTAANVLGLFVSYSGFTQGAIDRVQGTPERPILLVTGDELEQVVGNAEDFPRMLRRKRDAMVTHAKAIFVSNQRQVNSLEQTNSLPSSPETFVLSDGTRSSWLYCGGRFGRFIFMRELFDIDWVPGAGFGVVLDIPLEVTDEHGLLALLNRLATLGWVTSSGRWSIQQSAHTWHGTGADAFAAQLADWKTRYKGLLDLHHTEEFCYADSYDELGFYTLTGQLAAWDERVVWRPSLSFQLNGVPIDPAPLHHLCEQFGITSNLYFRPRGEKSVARYHIEGNQGVILDVVGFVVEHDENEGDWVVGLIADNPFRRTSLGQLDSPEGWPKMVVDSELIICSLRSLHLLRSPKAIYRLWSYELAWTSDGLLFNPIADWDDDRDFWAVELPATCPVRLSRSKSIVIDP
ncbi:restriction endonuclease [Ferrimicrobium sp.]|uniref:restriction endonuclease n=1 Tax=Ferrimicrobium sp. TaxID=2926050 RepID=UPI0026267F3A|nr:restriction endonuclease [Ferrimicrobium sp.]